MAIIRPARLVDDNVCIPTAFIQDTTISAYAKLVYMSAAAHHQAGEPEPHRAVICAETGLSLEQVEVGTKELGAISDADWKRLGL